MRRIWLLLLVPLAIIVGTGVATWMLVNHERELAETRQATITRGQADRVRERLSTTVAQLSTTAGLFAASERVTETEFRAFSQTLLREPTIDTVAYIDRVPRGQRAAFERRLGKLVVDRQGRPVRGLPPRREYFPYAFQGSEPEQPRSTVIDASAEPMRAAALREARDTGTAQTTAPIKTFYTHLPALIVYSPVYRRAVPPRSLDARRASLRGYAVGIVPLKQLLAPNQATSVQVTDRGKRIAGARHLDAATSRPITLASRRFIVRVSTGVHPSYVLPATVALAGLGLALLMSAILFILLRRDAYAQRLVRERLAQQRKAEVALSESEQRHRQLADTSSDWITLVDTSGRYTYSSPSVRGLLGREPEDIVGRTFDELMHPADKSLGVEAFLKVYEHGDAASVDLRVRHADGHWVPLDVGITIISEPGTGQIQEIRTASRDATERHRLEQELRKLAVEDALTGLPNRRGLADRLEAELKTATRYGGGALILLDLDEFKEINDTRGHSAGDEVLQRVAWVMQNRLRESDHIARLGGDEFAVVLPRVDHDAAVTAANDLLEALRHDAGLLALYGRPVTASAGIALMHAAGAISAETLLVHADQAMYTAKRAGGDRSAFSALAAALP